MAKAGTCTYNQPWYRKCAYRINQTPPFFPIYFRVLPMVWVLRGVIFAIYYRHFWWTFRCWL